MGEVRQTEVSEVLLDTQEGPAGTFRTPDGIPPGWTVGYVAGRGWELRKIPPKPHWSSKLASWPSSRPSYVVTWIDLQDKIVFVTDGFGRRLLGLPFSEIEGVYNEISRV